MDNHYPALGNCDYRCWCRLYSGDTASDIVSWTPWQQQASRLMVLKTAIQDEFGIVHTELNIHASLMDSHLAFVKSKPWAPFLQINATWSTQYSSHVVLRQCDNERRESLLDATVVLFSLGIMDEIPTAPMEYWMSLELRTVIQSDEAKGVRSRCPSTFMAHVVCEHHRPLQCCPIAASTRCTKLILISTSVQLALDDGSKFISSAFYDRAHEVEMLTQSPNQIVSSTVRLPCMIAGVYGDNQLCNQDFTWDYLSDYATKGFGVTLGIPRYNMIVRRFMMPGLPTMQRLFGTSQRTNKGRFSIKTNLRFPASAPRPHPPTTPASYITQTVRCHQQGKSLGDWALGADMSSDMDSVVSTTTAQSHPRILKDDDVFAKSYKLWPHYLSPSRATTSTALTAPSGEMADIPKAVLESPPGEDMSYVETQVHHYTTLTDPKSGKSMTKENNKKEKVDQTEHLHKRRRSNVVEHQPKHSEPGAEMHYDYSNQPGYPVLPITRWIEINERTSRKRDSLGVGDVMFTREEANLAKAMTKHKMKSDRHLSQFRDYAGLQSKLKDHDDLILSIYLFMATPVVNECTVVSRPQYDQLEGFIGRPWGLLSRLKVSPTHSDWCFTDGLPHITDHLDYSGLSRHGERVRMRTSPHPAILSDTMGLLFTQIAEQDLYVAMFQIIGTNSHVNLKKCMVINDSSYPEEGHLTFDHSSGGTGHGHSAAIRGFYNVMVDLGGVDSFFQKCKVKKELARLGLRQSEFDSNLFTKGGMYILVFGESLIVATEEWQSIKDFVYKCQLEIQETTTLDAHIEVAVKRSIDWTNEDKNQFQAVSICQGGWIKELACKYAHKTASSISTNEFRMLTHSLSLISAISRPDTHSIARRIGQAMEDPQPEDKAKVLSLLEYLNSDRTRRQWFHRQALDEGGIGNMGAGFCLQTDATLVNQNHFGECIIAGVITRNNNIVAIHSAHIETAVESGMYFGELNMVTELSPRMTKLQLIYQESMEPPGDSDEQRVRNEQHHRFRINTTTRLNGLTAPFVNEAIWEWIDDGKADNAASTQLKAVKEWIINVERPTEKPWKSNAS